jgi:hypothetical protein
VEVIDRGIRRRHECAENGFTLYLFTGSPATRADLERIAAALKAQIDFSGAVGGNDEIFGKPTVPANADDGILIPLVREFRLGFCFYHKVPRPVSADIGGISALWYSWASRRNSRLRPAKSRGPRQRGNRSCPARPPGQPTPADHWGWFAVVSLVHVNAIRPSQEMNQLLTGVRHRDGPEHSV